MTAGPTRAGQALLGDIGGTNARFALLEDGRLGPVTALATAGYPTVADGFRLFLAENDGQPEQAILSVAGPVAANCAQLTNATWRIDGEELRQAFGLRRALVVNDFLALAHSLPALERDELLPIGTAASPGTGPKLVIGPGTGFGAALYLSGEDNLGQVVPTEAGHATLAAATELEAQILGQLRSQFGHMAVEDLISGPGLELLDQTLAILANNSVPSRTAAEIVAAAETGDAAADETLAVFLSWLGSVAGNLALSTGATGGVYLAGGILPRLADRLRDSGFRERFEAKGRMAAYLAAIPTWLITAPNPAFKGLARLATLG